MRSAGDEGGELDEYKPKGEGTLERSFSVIRSLSEELSFTIFLQFCYLPKECTWFTGQIPDCAMKREKSTADRFGEGKKKRGDRLRYVGGVILFALLYALLAGVAFEFFSEETHIPLIWIPGGFSLGVLLRFGLRYWPGIILAILAPSYYYTASAGFTLGIAANNTFTAILGAVMLRSVAGFIGCGF